ncbi:hypothetical protein DFJ77DRAFT_524012 [Powellomyces hirtus]|nr:hypothetical protein DFJ77DRAFT_524012 [Powellomyces hirtus]
MNKLKAEVAAAQDGQVLLPSNGTHLSPWKAQPLDSIGSAQVFKHQTSRQETLGTHLRTLLGASLPALRNASVDFAQRVNTPLTVALRGLEDYVDMHVADYVLGMREIWAPLADKIMKKDGTERKKAMEILKCLINGRHGVWLQKALEQVLAREDKKEKLALASFVQFVSPRHSADKVYISDEPSQHAMDLVVPLASAFLNCVRICSTVDPTGCKVHTRLTLSCFDASLVLVRHAAERLLRAPPSSKNAIDALLEQILEILSIMQSFLAGDSPLDDIQFMRNAISEVQRYPTSTLVDNSNHVSQLCDSIANGLQYSRAMASENKFNEYLDKILDEPPLSKTASDKMYLAIRVYCGMLDRQTSKYEEICQQIPLEEKASNVFLEALICNGGYHNHHSATSPIPAMFVPVPFQLLGRILPFCTAKRLVAITDKLICQMVAEQMLSIPAADLIRESLLLSIDDVAPLLCKKIRDAETGGRNLVASLVQLLVDGDPGKRPREILTTYAIAQLSGPTWHKDKGLIALLPYLDTTRIIPVVSNSVLSCVDQKPAKADQEAVTAMLSHRDAEFTAVFALIHYIRSVEGTIRAGTTPDPRTSGAPKEKDASPLLKLLEAWAAQQPVSTWLLFTPRLVSEIYAAPSDTTFVKIASSLATYWTDPRVGVCIVESVAGIMYEQDQSAANQASMIQTTPETSPDAIFSRLSPLLILKVLPPQSLTWMHKPQKVPKGGEGKIITLSRDIVGLLLSRSLDSTEFQDVRTAALTVLSGCPLALTNNILQTLVDDGSGVDPNLTHLKAALWCACCIFASHPAAECAPLVEIMTPPCMQWGVRYCGDEEPGFTLRRNSTEFLALTLPHFPALRHTLLAIATDTKSGDERLDRTARVLRILSRTFQLAVMNKLNVVDLACATCAHVVEAIEGPGQTALVEIALQTLFFIVHASVMPLTPSSTLSSSKPILVKGVLPTSPDKLIALCTKHLTSNQDTIVDPAMKLAAACVSCLPSAAPAALADLERAVTAVVDRKLAARDLIIADVGQRLLVVLRQLLSTL